MSQRALIPHRSQSQCNDRPVQALPFETALFLFPLTDVKIPTMHLCDWDNTVLDRLYCGNDGYSGLVEVSCTFNSYLAVFLSL